MTTYKRAGFLSLLIVSTLLRPSVARGGDSETVLGLGALRGVTLDASGHPLAMVSIVIQSIVYGTDLMVVSDQDGSFAADHLKPGPYRITARKDGLGTSPAATVEVAQNQTTRPYLVLTAANAAPAAAPLTIEQELQAMKERIAALEAELRARPAAPPVTATAAAEPPAQQKPADLTNPQVGGKAPVPTTPPAPVAVPHLP
jgi:hypothetical protein